MKKPHFPEPRSVETTPYREASLPLEVTPSDAPRGVVASRPEPPTPEGSEPLLGLSARERREHARALLAVDAGKNPTRFRARVLIVPVVAVAWRTKLLPPELRFLWYPLGLIALVILILEVRRKLRGTDRVGAP